MEDPNGKYDSICLNCYGLDTPTMNVSSGSKSGSGDININVNAENSTRHYSFDNKLVAGVNVCENVTVNKPEVILKYNKNEGKYYFERLDVRSRASPVTPPDSDDDDFLNNVFIMPGDGELFNGLEMNVTRRTVVPRVEQNRIINRNGVYIPSRGYDVFGPVTVDVTPVNNEVKFIYSGYENLYKDDENVKLRLLGANIHDVLLDQCPFDYMYYDLNSDIDILNYRIDLGTGKIIVHEEMDIENQDHLYFIKDDEIVTSLPEEYDGFDLDLVKYPYISVTTFEEDVKDGQLLVQNNLSWEMVQGITEIYSNEDVIDVVRDNGRLLIRRVVYKLEDLFTTDRFIFDFNSVDNLIDYINEEYESEELTNEWTLAPYYPVYLLKVGFQLLCYKKSELYALMNTEFRGRLMGVSVSGFEYGTGNFELHKDSSNLAVKTFNIINCLINSANGKFDFKEKSYELTKTKNRNLKDRIKNINIKLEDFLFDQIEYFNEDFELVVKYIQNDSMFIRLDEGQFNQISLNSNELDLLVMKVGSKYGYVFIKGIESIKLKGDSYKIISMDDQDDICEVFDDVVDEYFVYKQVRFSYSKASYGFDIKIPLLRNNNDIEIMVYDEDESPNYVNEMLICYDNKIKHLLLTNFIITNYEYI